MIVLRLCRDILGIFLNSTSGFELIDNLNNTILAKCTDYSTIHANFFIPTLYVFAVLFFCSNTILTE